MNNKKIEMKNNNNTQSVKTYCPLFPGFEDDNYNPINIICDYNINVVNKEFREIDYGQYYDVVGARYCNLLRKKSNGLIVEFKNINANYYTIECDIVVNTEKLHNFIYENIDVYKTAINNGGFVFFGGYNNKLPPVFNQWEKETNNFTVFDSFYEFKNQIVLGFLLEIYFDIIDICDDDIYNDLNPKDILLESNILVKIIDFNWNVINEYWNMDELLMKEFKDNFSVEDESEDFFGYFGILVKECKELEKLYTMCNWIDIIVNKYPQETYNYLVKYCDCNFSENDYYCLYYL